MKLFITFSKILLPQLTNKRFHETVADCLYTSIVQWRNSHQFGFYFIAYIKLTDKFMNSFFIHCLVCTRKRLQSFIRMRIAFAPQNRLNSLSHHSPCIFKVSLNTLVMQNKLTQSLQCTLNRDDTMPHWYTNIAKNSRIS